MIQIYCDLKNRTRINNLPSWGKTKIESKNKKKIKIIYSITEEKIKLMPNLKWIHFASSGTNRANLKIIKEKKIIITNSPDGFVHSLATLGLAHIFSFVRGINFANNLKREKKLNRKEIDRFFHLIDDLRDKNILIAGYGKVGKLIAKVLKI